MLAESFSFQLKKNGGREEIKNRSDVDKKIVHRGYLYISCEEDGGVWIRRWCQLTTSSFIITQNCMQNSQAPGRHFSHSDLLLILLDNPTIASINLKYRNILLHLRTACTNEAHEWIKSISKASGIPCPPMLPNSVVSHYLEASLADTSLNFEEFQFGVENSHKDDDVSQSDKTVRLGAPDNTDKSRYSAWRKSFIDFFRSFCKQLRKAAKQGSKVMRAKTVNKMTCNYQVTSQKSVSGEDGSGTSASVQSA